MTRLSAIAYLSTATSRLSESDLEALLATARHFNDTVGVTGALLVHDITFFQYFEGPADAVDKFYKRVSASKAHKDNIELMHQPTAQCGTGLAYICRNKCR